MASKAVAETSSAVPAMVHRPALEIDGGDIALPRLYIGQFMSDAVKDGIVKAGSIYAATGQDDPDPQVLAAGDPKVGVSRENGITIHILGMRKGKSFSDGGELQLFDFHDPAAPKEAWVTYNYTVCIPEVDAEVPFKWLLTKSGAATAKSMNMVLMKSGAPAHEVAFKFWTAKRENQKGEWFVAQAARVDADPANVETAERLSAMVAGHTAEYNSTAAQPDI